MYFLLGVQPSYNVGLITLHFLCMQLKSVQDENEDLHVQVNQLQRMYAKNLSEEHGLYLEE